MIKPIRRLIVIVYLLSGLQSLSLAQTAMLATQITAQDVGALQVGGIGSIGGIDDWALSNGTLCAVISDSAHETSLSAYGGALVDLGHCGRNDDQWTSFNGMLNLSQSHYLQVNAISAQVQPSLAQITVTAKHGDISATTTFRLDDKQVNSLWIETRLERIDKPQKTDSEEPLKLNFYGEIVIHSHRTLAGFTTSIKHPSHATGFVHPYLDVSDSSTIIDAISDAELNILVGANHIEPGISYAIELLDAQLIKKNGEIQTLDMFSMNTQGITIVGAFSQPFWLGGGGKPGILEMLQSQFMDLQAGDIYVFSRRIVVGDRSDVASTTNQLFKGDRSVSGKVDNVAARLHITRENGLPVTQIKPDKDGRFSARLPEYGQDFYLDVKSPWRPKQSIAFRATRDTQLGTISTGAPARVQLPQGQAMRLIFKGINGTADPLFNDDLLDYRFGGKDFKSGISSSSVSLAGIPADKKSIELPAGEYRIYASRGLEFSVTESTLVAKAGQQQSLSIAVPQRAVSSTGWISADLHVHASRSFDSTIPTNDRLIGFAAEGAEILVATEHDMIHDYSPQVQTLGLQSKLAVITGTEMTSLARSKRAPSTIGHANVFPLHAHPERYAGGIPKHENSYLRDVIAQTRQSNPDAVFQLNHPRWEGEPSDDYFFQHLSIGKQFDPGKPLTDANNNSLLTRGTEHGLRDIDFHIMEINNGDNYDSYRLMRADWFSLILQGEFRTATSNSDSHQMKSIVAAPRNYVKMTDDTIQNFDTKEFLNALKQGNVFGSSGPLLDVSYNGAGPGELASAGTGVLRVSVQAAPWVPVDKLTIYLNGVAQSQSISAGDTLEIPLQISEDAFITVQVIGQATTLYHTILPGFTPFAFSNPIFIDADSDGQWHAPGLPDQALVPQAITSPLASD